MMRSDSALAIQPKDGSAVLKAATSCRSILDGGVSNMRKSLWMLPMVLLITALGSIPAHADGIVLTNGDGYVTAIDDITLNGTLYDVTCKHHR
jgi:hypothetical protein